MKRTYEDKENMLVEKIREANHTDIEDFLGYPISAEVMENLEDRIREVLDQMPEEEIEMFYNKYCDTNKAKYNLKHISCDMADFNADRHRFRFEYNDKEYIASCYGALDVFLDEETEKEVPEEVFCEIEEIIWDKIDKEEKNWRYPKEAYEIANKYCDER